MAKTLRDKIIETLRDMPHTHVEHRADVIISWFTAELDCIKRDDDTGYHDPRYAYFYGNDVEKLIG
jgi:hypothetical protein